MKPAPFPANEAARLRALRRHRLLNSMPEEEYDEITRIASEICGTPIAIINLVDETKQWPKAGYGIDMKELPREQSICAHAILNPDNIMIVPDTRFDERFHDNPLVTADPPVIFYAGIPIVDTENHALGTLCIVDSRPRELSDQKLMALKALAKLIQKNFELRIAKFQLKESKERFLKVQPLVDTIQSEVELLEKSDLNAEQTGKTIQIKHTTAALNELLKHSDFIA